MILKAIHPTHEHPSVTSILEGIEEVRSCDVTMRMLLELSTTEPPEDRPERWYCDPAADPDSALVLLDMILGNRRPMKVVVAPGWAYLMNDQGKTIERY